MDKFTMLFFLVLLAIHAILSFCNHYVFNTIPILKKICFVSLRFLGAEEKNPLQGCLAVTQTSAPKAFTSTGALPSVSAITAATQRRGKFLPSDKLPKHDCTNTHPRRNVRANASENHFNQAKSPNKEYR